ncbi:hypothetical protein [Tropicibacter naphthalenivorans]|uniref:Uncharacterized protein n=1 Tax=Tropicibacter naphthalenivorans TaxID=441103 RepID=A0A0P1GXF9_9RHOB|nr:hypothetical protein [Tropicibacter naphthalenivorans]CUH78602.1 hypothetical protein TRN7648_02065 [Tropicibacter naphthalenivorans]SMC81011.1 hypothetical protein SAMN04488093_104226 [Tropicibacter naphthalenivorans]
MIKQLLNPVGLALMALVAGPVSAQMVETPYATVKGWDVNSIQLDGSFAGCGPARSSAASCWS